MLNYVIRLKPGKVALLVAGLYLAITLLVLWRTPALQPQLHSLPDRLFAFIHPGSNWDINGARPINLEKIGYDGQFFYDLALNPLHPATQLDKPSYRVARLLYPLVVRLLSLGQAELVPLMLLLVNFGSIVATIFLLGNILTRLGRAPIWAFGYALWPGTLCAYLYDLSEPLCFLFITLALWLFLVRPSAVWQIAVLLLLASLTKELGLLFGVGGLLYYLSRKEWANVVKLGLGWLLPYALWQGLLRLWFGQDGLSAGHPFNFFPLSGLWGAESYHPPFEERFAIVLATTVPLLWLGWRLRPFWNRKFVRLSATYGDLLLSILVCQVAFLLFLPTASYIYLVDHARNATGLILVIYLLPITLFKRLQIYSLLASLFLSVWVLVVYYVSGNAFI